MGNITSFKGMDAEIKILNKKELAEKKKKIYKNKSRDEIYEDLMFIRSEIINVEKQISEDKDKFKDFISNSNKINNDYESLVNRYDDSEKDKQLTILGSETEQLKEKLEIIQKEIILTNLTADQEDSMNVNIFKCKKCGWNSTSTLFGAPHKCGGCGSRDYFERAVSVTSKKKIDYNNLVWIKFNPDANKYRDKIALKGDVDIQEKIDSLTAQIEAKLKSTKSIKEKKMTEQKTYVVRCTGDKCNFSFETQESSLHTRGIEQCQICGFPNSIQEKQPIKKISRFDR